MFDIKKLIKEQNYSLIKKEISKLSYYDIASILEDLKVKELIKIFRLLPKDKAADVFSYFEPETKKLIITSLTDKEAVNIIDNLYSDDAADLMEEMPANIVKKLLVQANPETRKTINYLLKYKESSAGSIMTVDFVDLKSSLTVEEALNKIKKIGINKETIDICYVLDNERRLIGTVFLRQLILSKSNKKIEQIMNSNTITIHTLMDQEDVAKMFKKYDLVAMPVVDSENRLVGIITVDDIVDVMEKETTEDIEKMNAIRPSDKSYMKTGIFATFKKRIPWLLILMISATFTGKIIQSYENALSKYVILTSFIPMFMDTGGNAGGQAAATIIRGLSLNEIKYKDVLKVIWKEIRVAVLIGITLAIANFFKLMIIDSVTLQVALVVCLTLVFTVILAKFIGCTLPIAAQKLGFDPAVMASPFITTIVDALSLFIYFQIATILLQL